MGWEPAQVSHVLGKCFHPHQKGYVFVSVTYFVCSDGLAVNLINQQIYIIFCQQNIVALLTLDIILSTEVNIQLTIDSFLVMIWIHRKLAISHDYETNRNTADLHDQSYILRSWDDT